LAAIPRRGAYDPHETSASHQYFAATSTRTSSKVQFGQLKFHALRSLEAGMRRRDFIGLIGAISQPKGLERNLRNELIASPAI
jgi:hypothetical protein